MLISGLSSLSFTMETMAVKSSGGCPSKFPASRRPEQQGCCQSTFLTNIKGGNEIKCQRHQDCRGQDSLTLVPHWVHVPANICPVQEDWVYSRWRVEKSQYMQSKILPKTLSWNPETALSAGAQEAWKKLAEGEPPLLFQSHIFHGWKVEFAEEKGRKADDEEERRKVCPAHAELRLNTLRNWGGELSPELRLWRHRQRELQEVMTRSGGELERRRGPNCGKCCPRVDKWGKYRRLRGFLWHISTLKCEKVNIFSRVFLNFLIIFVISMSWLWVFVVLCIFFF